MVGLVLLALALGVAAFLIGKGSGSESSASADNTASAGSLELGFPDGWARLDQPPEIPGLALRDPIAVGPAGAGSSNGVLAGQARASHATLLPAEPREAAGGRAVAR